MGLESFDVVRFIGFGELSFRWIQICIGSPMRRSSYLKVNTQSDIYSVLEVCTPQYFLGNIFHLIVLGSLMDC